MQGCLSLLLLHSTFIQVITLSPRKQSEQTSDIVYAVDASRMAQKTFIPLGNDEIPG